MPHLLLFALLFSASLAAASSAVTGQVSLPSPEPVNEDPPPRVGAVEGRVYSRECSSPKGWISVALQGPEHRDNLLSRENGLFRFENVPEGRYRLVVGSLGLMTEIDSVEVRYGLTTERIMYVSEDPSFRFGSVIDPQPSDGGSVCAMHGVEMRRVIVTLELGFGCNAPRETEKQRLQRLREYPNADPRVRGGVDLQGVPRGIWAYRCARCVDAMQVAHRHPDWPLEPTSVPPHWPEYSFRDELVFRAPPGGVQFPIESNCGAAWRFDSLEVEIHTGSPFSFPPEIGPPGQYLRQIVDRTFADLYLATRGDRTSIHKAVLLVPNVPGRQAAAQVTVRRLPGGNTSQLDAVVQSIRFLSGVREDGGQAQDRGATQGR